MTIQPYLFFAGRADEAITFYQKVFGAELQMLLRFKDSPDPAPPGTIAPGWENKVMHSSLKIGESIVLASDGCGSDATGFKGFGLSYGMTTAWSAKCCRRRTNQLPLIRAVPMRSDSAFAGLGWAKGEAAARVDTTGVRGRLPCRPRAAARARHQRQPTAQDFRMRQQPTAPLGAHWCAPLCRPGSGRGLAGHPAMDVGPGPSARNSTPE